MDNSKLRVAAYCRVSTDKDDQVNSLESQRRYFEEYISRNPDWYLVNVYYDEGISGTSTKKRESFNQMLADAREGFIDLILTKEVSRFARNTVDTLQITRDLKNIGVRVKFVNDNIDTFDCDGELRLTIMASIAQEESRKTSERVKWGQKRRMEQGVVFGRDMLGYRVKNGQLEIVPEEAKIVQSIFYKYLYEGKGTNTIAHELAEAGIYTIKGNYWSNAVLLRVLRNEKYVGDLLQKKTITPDYLTHAKKYNHGEEEMVYIRDHHEAIIDRETWEATQKELAKRSPSAENRSKHSNRYWCSGKLVCGECGLTMVSRKRKRKNGSYNKAWVCRSSTRHGVVKIDSAGNVIGCNNREVNEKILKAAMRSVLLMVQTDKKKLIDDIMQDIREVQNTKTDVDTLKIKKQITDIENKKTKAIDMMIDGLITKADLQKQQAYYDSRIEVLASKLREYELAEQVKTKQVDQLNQCIEELEKMMNYDIESEEIYRATLEQIIFYKDCKLDVKLKGLPFKVRLCYETKGKMEDYSVIFHQVEVLED